MGVLRPQSRERLRHPFAWRKCQYLNDFTCLRRRDSWGVMGFAFSPREAGEIDLEYTLSRNRHSLSVTITERNVDEPY
ncbi:hypothetical protein GCM10023094_56650 [Rhodococcus olei]|uniref:Uncharacterized protein n=1 Tax=Rhodococcus olei TaxID=2161675 RepID=A0ABP8PV65_9NOCA